MVVTLSLVLVFGVALAFLLRAKTLGLGSGFIAVMFGFYLATTPAGPPVRHLVASIVTALSHIH